MSECLWASKGLSRVSAGTNDGEAPATLLHFGLPYSSSHMRIKLGHQAVTQFNNILVKLSSSTSLLASSQPLVPHQAEPQTPLGGLLQTPLRGGLLHTYTHTLPSPPEPWQLQWAHLCFIVPDGTAPILQQLRVVAALATVGTLVVPHLDRRETAFGTALRHRGIRNSIFQHQSQFQRLGMRHEVTFSLTVAMREMASPMRSALPTRPMRWT